jgi:flavin reductase (DIM6/NTAB) family NADH-FMN oxidoreductase RutF
MVSEEQFKSLLGEYATTVTVVTTQIEDRKAGLTVSSFCSVSLTPPLVLICVEKEARTNKLLVEGADFTVNILRDDQTEVSQRFAEPGLAIEDQLRNLNYSLPERGGPILTESLAWMTCEQYETTDGGDHVIYVGEVLEGQPETEGNPLLYYQGDYGSFE